MIEKLKEIKQFADEIHNDDNATGMERIIAVELFTATSKMIRELSKKEPMHYELKSYPVSCEVSAQEKGISE